MFTCRFCLSVALLAGLATAQVTTSRVDGAVQDSSNAIIANVHITCVNVKTGLKHEATSDERGFFQFNSLPPGIYMLTAEAAGFTTKVVKDYQLTVAETAALIITMNVGDIKTTITVEAADMAHVQTTDAQMSQVITGREIDALPLGHEVLQVTRYLQNLVTERKRIDFPSRD